MKAAKATTAQDAEKRQTRAETANKETEEAGKSDSVEGVRRREMHLGSYVIAYIYIVE